MLSDQFIELYTTPDDVANLGVQYAIARYSDLQEDSRQPYTILEPGCGPEAPFLRAANDYVLEFIPFCNDLVPFHKTKLNDDMYDHYTKCNYLYWSDKSFLFDLIITNPPFTLAEEFMVHSVDLLSRIRYSAIGKGDDKITGICCFILRLSMLSSIKRKIMWRDKIRLLEVGVLDRRPKFKGEGTDAKTDYGFFIFSAPRSFPKWGPPRIYWL